MIKFVVLFVLLGLLVACDPAAPAESSYPTQRPLDPCPEAAAQTLTALLPAHAATQPDCHWVFFTAQDSFLAKPTAAGQLVVVLSLQHVDRGFIEQAIPLYFDLQGDQLLYDQAGQALVPFAQFGATDYQMALKTDPNAFPHPRFLRSLLIQSLQGSAEARALFSKYGEDFQTVLEQNGGLEDHQKWLTWLSVLNPQKNTTTTAEQPTWSIRTDGDPNLLTWPMPLLPEEQKSALAQPEIQKGYVYQGHQCLAQAYQNPNQGPLQLWCSVPIYLSFNAPFELDEALDLGLTFEWQEGRYQYQKTHWLQPSSDQPILLKNLPLSYQSLLGAEKTYAEDLVVPPAAHRDRLGALLTQVLHAYLMGSTAASNHWPQFASDFAHSLRYAPEIRAYHRTLNQLTQLLTAQLPALEEGPS